MRKICRVIAAFATLGGLFLQSAASLANAQDATPIALSNLAADSVSLALAEKSKRLKAPEKDSARSLFATGFQLWKDGDFGAAELAFKRGLDIDPANAAANFYLGDIFERKALTAGELYFRRAIWFGPGTAEAFKAQAALSAMSEKLSSWAASLSRDESVENCRHQTDDTHTARQKVATCTLSAASESEPKKIEHC